jgi:hypothetical protein
MGGGQSTNTIIYRPPGYTQPTPPSRADQIPVAPLTAPDPALSTPVASNDIGSTLANLPLDFLFSTPFEAAYQAQGELAMSTASFIKRFGLTPSNEMLEFTVSSSYDIPAANLQDASGNQALFLWLDEAGMPTINRPGIGGNQAIPPPAVTDPPSTPAQIAEALRPEFAKRVFNKENVQALGGTFINALDISGVGVHIDDSGRIVGSQGSRALTLPFITLLNVPCLSITEVNVDFIIEIKTQNTKTKNTTYDAITKRRIEERTTGRANFWSGWNDNTTATETSASISQKQAATDSTSTATTYQVHMQAIDQQPIGMKILLDFVTNNKDSVAPSILGPDKLSMKPVLNKDGFYNFA